MKQKSTDRVWPANDVAKGDNPYEAIGEAALLPAVRCAAGGMRIVMPVGGKILNARIVNEDGSRAVEVVIERIPTLSTIHQEGKMWDAEGEKPQCRGFPLRLLSRLP